MAQQLHKYDLDKLKFIGHTDNVGLASYNQTLSEKRAQSVAQIFLDQGYERKNILVTVADYSGNSYSIYFRHIYFNVVDLYKKQTCKPHHQYNYSDFLFFTCLFCRYSLTIFFL